MCCEIDLEEYWYTIFVIDTTESEIESEKGDDSSDDALYERSCAGRVP